METTFFMINEELNYTIKEFIKSYKPKGEQKYLSIEDFIKEAIIEKYFKELGYLKKEPTKKISKQIKELVDGAYINGDLNSLHEAFIIIKDRYKKLLIE